MKDTNVDFVDYVEKFMVACDQTVDTENEEQANLYYRLICEESDEIYSARLNSIRMKEFDISSYNVQALNVEELDGCADLIWVIIGYCLSKGWDIKGAFSEVARSNMSKIDTETGKVLKREDGKVMKPSTFSPPELSRFTKRG